MTHDDTKKKDIEEHGHDASLDELEPMEPATPAGEAGATQTTLPEDTDGVDFENTFPSAPANPEEE
jgi:hypothetical protein